MRSSPTACRGLRHGWPLALVALTAVAVVLGAAPVSAQLPPQLPPDTNPNEPGILEPVTSTLQGKDIRVPNTDQSADGLEQSNVEGDIVIEDALTTTSMLGHPITHVASPNDDMRWALMDLVDAAQQANQSAMEGAAQELLDILLGTTQGRIYDGFSMLNFNRWKDPSIPASAFPPDAVEGEYKFKEAVDTGDRFISPFDGEERKVWEIDVNMLYYDGQIDSDTFLVLFPREVHKDDTLRVNYRIFSLVEEDFSPTLVMLDRREAQNTVNFPFKGFDSVWIAFFPGEVLNVSINYPPSRMVRGVYTWGWRVHPPRIQFMQPLYEIENKHTGETVYDPQSESFVFRNREDLTIDAIADAAPEKKMYQVAQAVLDGADPVTILEWLIEPDQGPRGTWFEWAELVKNQRQIPPEARDILLAEEGLEEGEFGDFNMITTYMNNEMYGNGPFLNEIRTWNQGDRFKVKLINLDNHTHYFRNVDFGARLHDDILRCCGGGETSFEIMNFKPSYGAPKVAEVQWRAGWGFRPHHNVIQQQGVFSRGQDRTKLAPYTGGFGDVHFGYQYSAEHRGGDFRFSPPPFIITDTENPAPNPLRDHDGEAGLMIGQFTEGYGVAQFCPDDPPGFCSQDISANNPNGAMNWPPPPLQGKNGLPDHPTELRFPPFLRNPAQGAEGAGDIIPPTAAWRPFLWLNPNNGSLFLDPDNPEKGYWVDLTYGHGAPVFSGDTRTATVELPRASAQVFYQFDDLFHDNAIFSPHPVFAGFGEPDQRDEIRQVRATVRGNTLRVRGKTSLFSAEEGHAGWVVVYDGAATEFGCSGNVLGTAQVESSNGHFVFRQQGTDLAPGASVCVQSSIGGFADKAIGQF